MGALIGATAGVTLGLITFDVDEQAFFALASGGVGSLVGSVAGNAIYSWSPIYP